MDETNKQLSEEIFEQVARIGKALSNPKRLEILELLSQSPRTVEALAREAHLSQANTSQHLQALRSVHLVAGTRDGTSIWYRITDESVGNFFRSLRVLAVTHLAELDRIVGQYFEEQGSLEPVDEKTLLKRVRKGDVTVIDVRPREEYDSAHIPGAISIPIDELEMRLGELPKGRDVVAYCRGPYCIWSGQAVKLLRDNGFAAIHLSDGVLDWRARGFRVSTNVA